MSDGRDECGDFKMGKCRRGAGCKFSHGMGGMMGGGMADFGGGGADADECGDFKMGKCRRGNGCKFSHGGSMGGMGGAPPPPSARGGSNLSGPFMDARTGRFYMYNQQTGQSEWAPPGMVPGGMGMGAPQDDRPACGDFKSGKCSRGQGCRFSHGQGGGSSSMMPMMMSAFAGKGGGGGRGSTNECGDHKMGKCNRGDGCKFSHGAEDKRFAPDCGDFKRGICSRGDSCKFRHETRTECADFRRGVCSREDCKFSHDSSDGARERSRSR